MVEGPIDLSVFNELQEATGSDFIKELVATFLEESPGILAELKSAVLTGELEQFRRAAHSIKSNANVFGAHELAELGRQMELSGLRPDQEATNRDVVALDAAYERSTAGLKALLDG
ncbi:Hpt domain-containing protein [Alphaproteobacteria bacterium]|jgi:histidine phosphotransfer protein HptB|nr:Hpt domain-containing protein [Alphaproteobacteria bacterium]